MNWPELKLSSLFMKWPVNLISDKRPSPIGWPVIRIRPASYQPAGILCYHDRPTGQGNVYSKLTGQWYILPLNTEQPGFCVPITDRLAEVINVHSKPTGQWHILLLHTDRPGFCVTITD